MSRAAGAAQGPPGGRVTEEEKPTAGWSLPPTPGVSAPSPQPRPPRSARGPPQEPGVRSLRTPHSHLLSSALPPSQARASALPTPGLPPEWEGAAVPPPRPFPPGPAAAARPDAGLAARGPAAPPTDGWMREPAAGRRDPAGGRRPPPRSGTGRGRGRRRRKGRRQIAAVSAYGADTRVSGRPKSSARPTWDPRRSPDPRAGRKAWSGVFVGRLLET